MSEALAAWFWLVGTVFTLRFAIYARIGEPVWALLIVSALWPAIFTIAYALSLWDALTAPPDGSGKIPLDNELPR